MDNQTRKPQQEPGNGYLDMKITRKTLALKITYEKLIVYDGYALFKSLHITILTLRAPCVID